MITAKVVIDITPLRRFSSALNADLRRTGNSHVRAAFKKWAARYRSFLRERFSAQSRGGGEWPNLAPSTIERRRKGKGSKKFKKGTVAILIDTGTLFGALEPVFSGKPGQFEEDIDFGIAVGYGGRNLHPSGGMRAITVEEIAGFHQAGGPNLPQRRIIVDPTASVMNGMATDMDLALQRMAKETGNQ